MTVNSTNKTSSALAWATMVCGILSWALLPLIPLGPDIVAIVIGGLALKSISKDAIRIRRIALIGFWLGLSNLLLKILIMGWVFIAFMINPVAH
ncbi:hypothetical protein HZA56_22915 [Candidatus Poribacteria bacterium]|nr:hypothetical protein [Candidatus Poribacteria bacterium]